MMANPTEKSFIKVKWEGAPEEFTKEKQARIKAYIQNKYKCKNVIITGGEPLLQRNQLMHLVRLLYLDEFKVYIETNGTFYDKDIFNFTEEINCSPKKQQVDEDILYNLNIFHRVNFKFVYEDKNDLWFEQVIASIKIPKEKVWIMPEGKTREEQINKMPEVIEYCKLKGYNFTPRLHCLVWSNVKGK